MVGEVRCMDDDRHDHVDRDVCACFVGSPDCSPGCRWRTHRSSPLVRVLEQYLCRSRACGWRTYIVPTGVTWSYLYVATYLQSTIRYQLVGAVESDGHARKCRAGLYLRNMSRIQPTDS